MEPYDKRKERSEQEKLIRGEVESTPVNQNTEKAPLTFAMKIKLQGVRIGAIIALYYGEVLNPKLSGFAQVHRTAVLGLFCGISYQSGRY